MLIRQITWVTPSYKNGKPTIWRQTSLNRLVLNLFMTEMFISGCLSGSGAPAVFRKRLAVAKNEGVAFSAPFTRISVYKGGEFFEVPILYMLQDSAGGELILQTDTTPSFFPQACVQVKSCLVEGGSFKFSDWSESYKRPQAANLLGVTIPTPPYRPYLYEADICIPAGKVLAYQRGRLSGSYPMVFEKANLSNMACIIPTGMFMHTDERSPFRDPRLCGMWACCTEDSVRLVDAFLADTLKELVPLFAKGDEGADVLFFQANDGMYQQMLTAVLCLTFEVLVLAGFLRSHDVEYLQNRMLEVGISLKPGKLSSSKVDLSSEIAFVETSLVDFLQKLPASLFPEQRRLCVAKKDSARLRYLMAERICRSVWFHWQTLAQPPAAFTN